MKKINPGIIVSLFVSSLISLQGCATEQPSLKIEDSLPPSKLAYYNDSFDKMREDVWEKAGFIYEKEQLRNFKYANMQVQNGQLIIETHNLGDVVEFVEFLPSLQNGFPVEHSTDLLRIGARPNNSTNSTTSPKRRKRCRG